MLSCMVQLIVSQLVKIVGCKYAKEMQKKLKSIHEGDDKIKEAKLQTFKSQFEGLKINDEEDIYMLRVNEVINSIRCLDEKIEDKVIVKKILSSLTSRFDAKFLSIKEVKDLNSFTLDEMHGSLIAYEMRISKTNIDDKEVIFKATKSSKSKINANEDEASNMDESNFIQKLKRV